ncbi:MAG: hypothetical protein JRJ84_14180 [Deltaproteobacteria bacterium]|nr:hypothetical protein [Deltaproteobacteria bacterium]
MRAMALLFTLSLSVTLLGCPADDVDETGDTDTTDTDEIDTGSETSAIVDAWRSDGDDISPLFQTALFDYVRIDATFHDDKNYEVEAENSSGQLFTFTGQFETDTSTTPHTIVLDQDTPSDARAEGIWQVDTTSGTVLTYEVVQVLPDIGATPPTPAGDFGSTVSAGLAVGDNIQTYVPLTR